MWVAFTAPGPGLLQPGQPGAEVLEEAGARPDQHRRDVHLHLVDQPVGQELLDDPRAAADRHGPVASGLPGRASAAWCRR